MSRYLAVFIIRGTDVEKVAEEAGETEIRRPLGLFFSRGRRNFSGVARRIKTTTIPKKLIVAGGHYASCAAQELLEHPFPRTRHHRDS